MELNRKFFGYRLRRRRFYATRRKLSLHAGWTIALDAERLYGMSFYNLHSQREFTSILTSALTSET